MIILAAEMFGQKAGNYVHENSILSLLPYVPAILGVLGIGHLLQKHGESAPPPTSTPQLA
jgi:hypothetical protein